MAWNRIDGVVAAMTAELGDAGAEAVLLTGSHARGDAGALSDIDLHAIGNGPDYRLEMRDERVVSVSWQTRGEVTRSFLSPSSAGAAVPGWRSAVVLHDPAGIAADLVERARNWTWNDIGDGVLNA